MTRARPVIRRFTHTSAASSAADRILIIRLGALGDVVRTLPAVQAIRDHYTRARITWLVEPSAAGLLEGQPVIDEILVFPRDELSRDLGSGRWMKASRAAYSFARKLRREEFTLVLDFHSILKSGLLARLSGAPRRLAFGAPEGREFAALFANRVVKGSSHRRSRFERNAAMVRSLGIEAPRLAEYQFVPSPQSVSRMGELVRAGESPVAIHPGASSEKSYKRYAARDCGEVARLLAASQGIHSLVIHGPDPAERDLANQVVAASRGGAVLAPETRTPADLAALLAKCRLFIGADSGPLHLAALVGTPLVQLMGPTDPIQNAPFDATASRQLRVPLSCSPCRRGCEPAPCMALLSPRRVVREAEALLAGIESASRRSGIDSAESEPDRSRAGIA